MLLLIPFGYSDAMAERNDGNGMRVRDWERSCDSRVKRCERGYGGEGGISLRNSNFAGCSNTKLHVNVPCEYDVEIYF